MTKKKDVLIVGGCGYIGSRLYLHLKDTHNVKIADIGWFGNHVDADVLCGNYRDIASFDYDVVIVLAGHSSVPMCKDNMCASFNNNVVNFVNLLDKISSQTKLIYASSSSVYGETKDVEATEEWQYNPKTYYDLSKHEIDCYARLSGLDYYGLRFGTVNGFSPNFRSDIMINRMYITALNTGKIEIYNPDIFRAILGIKDLCRAMASIIEGKSNPGIYNLASFNASVVDIASGVASSVDVDVVDKGVSEAYDFSISTKKFENTYDFEFKDTIESIVCELKERWQDIANIETRKDSKYDLQ